MLRYVSLRAANSLVSLIGLVVLVFFLARLTGDPTDLYLPPEAPIEARQEFAERNGFNDPVLVQFGRFLGGVATFDFGNSLRQNRPALDLVLNAYPTTLILAVVSMTVALVVSVIVGALAAWRPNSAFDRVAGIISLAGASVPNFWIAIVGVLVFAVWLRWLPTSGTGTVLHWILPITVLFIRPCGLIVQVVRGAMISALSAPYVKTAYAKGVKDRSIIFVHAIRNAMLPVLTVAGDQAAGMINGAVIVEVVFGFPGVGKLMIESISYRDFAVIQAGVLLTAAAIFVLNILVDLSYAALDPRIRHS